MLQHPQVFNSVEAWLQVALLAQCNFALLNKKSIGDILAGNADVPGLAGGHHGHEVTYKGLTLHAPATWHTYVGKGMCSIMWSVWAAPAVLSTHTCKL